MKDPLIKNGRPKIEVDAAILIQLREKEHLGWTRVAKRYKELTGKWVSRDTLKRRYQELNRRFSANGLLLCNHLNNVGKLTYHKCLPHNNIPICLCNPAEH
jgi:hypothetical protein